MSAEGWRDHLWRERLAARKASLLQERERSEQPQAVPSARRDPVDMYVSEYSRTFNFQTVSPAFLARQKERHVRPSSIPLFAAICVKVDQTSTVRQKGIHATLPCTVARFPIAVLKISPARTLANARQRQKPPKLTYDTSRPEGCEEPSTNG